MTTPDNADTRRARRRAPIRDFSVSPSPLAGKSVLITGGTGSFGNAFVRDLLDRHDVRRLVIFSRDELKQFHMQQQLHDDRLRFFLGDVRDPERLRRAFHGVDVVVHAAALKQVPAAEQNPFEFVRTNVLGAENVISAALDQGVGRVIALSTDKAANPINLYGATKLCSDKLFVSGNSYAGADDVRFSVVRYGNVVGSRGSVVPFFKEQSKRGALPITDPRMTRFWITLQQGVDFVIACIQRMLGGEIFVPKIASMNIMDLAEAVAPGCEHEVVGVRPGEKLHELLIPEDDARRAVDMGDFYVIKPHFQFWKSWQDSPWDGGTPLADGFTYRSDNNPEWLSIDDLRRLIA